MFSQFAYSQPITSLRETEKLRCLASAVDWVYAHGRWLQPEHGNSIRSSLISLYLSLSFLKSFIIAFESFLAEVQFHQMKFWEDPSLDKAALNSLRFQLF